MQRHPALVIAGHLGHSDDPIQNKTEIQAK
jgi:hypothetical protein